MTANSLSAIADMLANALKMQGGCLCNWGYDMKRVGDPCGMCHALEQLELWKASEAIVQKVRKE